MEQRLKSIFDPHFNAPIEAWEYFSSLGNAVEYKKNEVIKQSYHIEKFGYFLIDGSCGLFVWKENNFVCLDLFLENSFFADDISLNSGEPSPIEIIALEKSTVFRISKSNIEQLKTGIVTAVGYEFYQRKNVAIDIKAKMTYRDVKMQEGKTNGLSFAILLVINLY